MTKFWGGKSVFVNIFPVVNGHQDKFSLKMKGKGFKPCFALKENWGCIGIFTNLEIAFFMSNFIFRQVVLVPSALRHARSYAYSRTSILLLPVQLFLHHQKLP